MGGGPNGGAGGYGQTGGIRGTTKSDYIYTNMAAGFGDNLGDPWGGSGGAVGNATEEDPMLNKGGDGYALIEWFY
jgi:hypothetical protein